jgi:hypothetical protein
LLVAFALSLLGTHLDRLTHGIGVHVLQNQWVYAQLSHGYALPLVPWTSLNNTVVVGGLLLGAVLFYPVFHLSESLLVKCGPLEASRLRQAVAHRVKARRKKAA